MKPFRFMIATRGIVDRPALVRGAQMAESIGYSHLAIHDHLSPQLAAIPMDERVGWVRDAAGARFEQLELSVLRLLGDVTVTRQPLKAATALARRPGERTGLPITPEDVLESPYSLIGSVPDLVDKLRRTRERWAINSFLVGWFDDAGIADIAPVVEQLAGT